MPCRARTISTAASTAAVNYATVSDRFSCKQLGELLSACIGALHRAARGLEGARLPGDAAVLLIFQREEILNHDRQFAHAIMAAQR
jgi:hypothetical protein